MDYGDVVTDPRRMAVPSALQGLLHFERRSRHLLSDGAEYTEYLQVRNNYAVLKSSSHISNTSVVRYVFWARTPEIISLNDFVRLASSHGRVPKQDVGPHGLAEDTG